MLITIITACIISAVLSALICLLIGPKRIAMISKPLSLMAVGILITLSLTHMLPHAFEDGDPHEIGLMCFIAVIALTVIEMLFNTHNHHLDSRHHKTRQALIAGGGLGLLSGSALHTFCDGVVIASAFLSDFHLGIAVTVAVVSHEVAHELGDYAVLVDSGLSYRQSFIVNAVALTGMLTGGLCAYFILNNSDHFLPYALALSAGSFIYVALSDLLPRLRRTDSRSIMLKRIVLILAGSALCFALSSHPEADSHHEAEPAAADLFENS